MIADLSLVAMQGMLSAARLRRSMCARALEKKTSRYSSSVGFARASRSTARKISCRRHCLAALHWSHVLDECARTRVLHNDGRARSC